MTDLIRILLVDDHKLFRESLARLLESEPDLFVAGHCATLGEAEQIITSVPVDVLLLDYDLGVEVGTAFLSTLSQMKNNVRVLMVTGGMRASATLKAVDAGISGLILKHNDPHQLITAIRRVAAGETWWDTDVLRSLGTSEEKSAIHTEHVKSLTERQRKILRNILDGFTNKEIASRIGVSETSVKATIQELFNKAGVRTRSQLVRVAIEQYSSDWLEDEQSNRA